MESWTIRKRIIAGFAIILVLFAGVATASFCFLKHVQQSVHSRQTDSLPGLMAVGRVKANAGEIQVALAQAARETADKIESSLSRTRLGVEISAKVASALNEIVLQVRQVDELMAEVANASREQTPSITQINTAVGQMDKVTQSNAASAEESASVAEELNAQAQTMKQSVAELMQLVGGQSQRDSNSQSAPRPGPLTSPSPV